MKILLIGAGGVGVYFCGRAAAGGAEVSVVVHSGAEEIEADGYQVQSIAGNFRFRPRAVYRSASEAGNGYDMVVLATKFLPETDRVSLLKTAADAPHHPPLILIQNGIGIENEIAEAFPLNKIISVVAYIGVSRQTPARIIHRGAGKLILGEFNSADTETAGKAAALFRAGGVECTVTPDIALERWRKLLWNLPFNPVSVLAGGVTTAGMCDRGELENLCAGLMREVIATANAAGTKLTENMAREQMEYTRNFPPYKTSMLQDFEAHRELEADAIVGNAVKIAEKHGVNVPLMRTVFALLKSADRMNLAGK